VSVCVSVCVCVCVSRSGVGSMKGIIKRE